MSTPMLAARPTTRPARAGGARDGDRARRPVGDGAESDDLDRWLCHRAATGDVDAFATLLRRHQDRIYRVALPIVGGPRDAEDVAQDVAVALWRAVGAYGGTSAFATWLHRIVINTSLNHVRRTPPPTLDAIPEVVAPSRTEDTVLAAESVRHALGAIAALPPDLRAAFVLHHLEGRSYREVASSLGVGEDTVRGRLARARCRLLLVLAS